MLSVLRTKTDPVSQDLEVLEDKLSHVSFSKSVAVEREVLSENNRVFLEILDHLYKAKRISDSFNGEEVSF